MLAMGEGEVELTIGGFLHDIGHLLKHEQATEAMGSFGVVNREGIGAAYLRERGFSERICAVVANHVAASDTWLQPIKLMRQNYHLRARKH